jgi:hypothetical protein
LVLAVQREAGAGVGAGFVSKSESSYPLCSVAADSTT